MGMARTNRKKIRLILAYLRYYVSDEKLEQDTLKSTEPICDSRSGNNVVKPYTDKLRSLETIRFHGSKNNRFLMKLKYNNCYLHLKMIR